MGLLPSHILKVKWLLFTDVKKTLDMDDRNLLKRLWGKGIFGKDIPGKIDKIYEGARKKWITTTSTGSKRTPDIL
jgi:hypothetical protein